MKVGTEVIACRDFEGSGFRCAANVRKWDRGQVTEKLTPDVFAARFNPYSISADFFYGNSSGEYEAKPLHRRSWLTTPADIACQGKY